MTPERPRKARITPDDHGPILEIVALFFMVTMVLSFLVRLMIRWTTGHIFGKDDAFALGAMVSHTVTEDCVADVSMLMDLFCPSYVLPQVRQRWL